MMALIAVTAQSAAIARAMPDPSGQMVICTGTGPVMVDTDQDGNPISAPHICPDFALSLLLALDIPPHVQVLPDFVRFRVHGSDPAPDIPLRLGAPNARAPPVVI